MKLCIDCKYFMAKEPTNPIPNSHVRDCRKWIKINPVNGDYFNMANAQHERSANTIESYLFGMCGINARFWEAK